MAIVFQSLGAIQQKSHFQSHLTAIMLVFKEFFFHDHHIMLSLPRVSPQRPFNLAQPQPESYHQPPLPSFAQLVDRLNKYSRYHSVYCNHISFGFSLLFSNNFKTFLPQQV